MEIGPGDGLDRPAVGPAPLDGVGHRHGQEGGAVLDRGGEDGVGHCRGGDAGIDEGENGGEDGSDVARQGGGVPGLDRRDVGLAPPDLACLTEMLHALVSALAERGDAQDDALAQLGVQA